MASSLSLLLPSLMAIITTKRRRKIPMLFQFLTFLHICTWLKYEWARRRRALEALALSVPQGMVN